MVAETMTQPLVRHMRLASTGGDGNTLVGLAVPFNSPTRIDSPFEGTFDEEFVRGAFKRSLGLRTPKLQFEHGTHPLYGSLPIGEFRSIKETARGLEFEARMFESELFAPLREAIASQDAIDGVSVRFRLRAVEITDADARTDGGDVELRTNTEAELLELGPVIFPAYPDTKIDLRNIDLNDKNDRRRLADALLAATVNTGQTPGTQGHGTEPEAGSPVVIVDQDSLHSTRQGQHVLDARKEFYQTWILKS